MGIVDLRDESYKLPLVGISVLGQGDLRYELCQHFVPLLIQYVSIGEPILDNVPEAVKGEDLESRVGTLETCVGKLMVERRISDASRERDVELLTGQQPVGMDRPQDLTEIASTQGLVGNPT